MKKVLWFKILMVCCIDLVHADDAAVLQALKKFAIQAPSVQSSPVDGLKTVMTENGVLYITTDGNYLLQGPLYALNGPQPVNVTHQLLNKKLQAMSSEMIVYQSPHEKHVITVFTDTTCGYCRKLHQQMQEYNELGISVRYLAFPRQGLSSQAEKDMRSIWCAVDRNKAFDAAIRGDAIAPVNCKIDISKHYQLGVWFGIQGTPAVVLQDGTVIPGYQEPKEMIKMLDTARTLVKIAG